MTPFGKEEDRELLQKEDENLFISEFPKQFYSYTPLEDKTKPNHLKSPEGIITHIPTGKRILYEVKSIFDDQEFTKRHQKVKRLVDKLERLPFPYKANLSVDTKLDDKIIKGFSGTVCATLRKLTPYTELPVVIEACDGLVSLVINSRNISCKLDVLGVRHGYGFFGQLPIIKRIRQRIESSRKKFDRAEFKQLAKVVVIFSHHGGDSQRLLEACFGDQYLGRKGYHKNGIFRKDKNTRFSAVILGITLINIVRKVEYFIVAMNPYAEIDLPFFWFDRANNQIWQASFEKNVIERIR